MILRFSTRGLLFLFSVLGGVLLLVNAGQYRPVNIVEELTSAMENPLQQIMESQVPGEAQPFLTGPLDVREFAETQLTRWLDPYERFMQPIMAALTFLFFQFFASVTYLIFALTVNPIFWMATRAGFFKVEGTQVLQEQLRF